MNINLIIYLIAFSVVTTAYVVSFFKIKKKYEKTSEEEEHVKKLNEITKELTNDENIIHTYPINRQQRIIWYGISDLLKKEEVIGLINSTIIHEHSVIGDLFSISVKQYDKNYIEIHVSNNSREGFTEFKKKLCFNA